MMAPARQRDPSIERTTEYEEFIKTLEAYHEKRGTTLDPEPKVGTRHIDLLRLYQRVCAEGGYDRASDTKGNKLAWRRIAAEFLPGSSNVTTQAFIVKSAYYKNLAAYEISDFHKKEPPPKEILEDVSAKGGDLLTRTLENFSRPISREAERLANGQELDSDESENEEQKTPKDEKMDIEDPGSTGGRVTRALRHAPPQRVLFQPDMTSTRQTRQSSQMNSPAPGSAAAHSQVNGTHTSNTAAMTIANYEPRPPLPSAVKPVTTPANNPDHFKAIRSRLTAARRASNRTQQHKGMMLPGTGFIGPNIYIRAQLALQSSLVQEEEYALHHLVKISHERGDKYQFDGFPGLAEALIEVVIQVSSLFYDVEWDISYTDEEVSPGKNSLNGLYGTRDLMEKIQALTLLDVGDHIHTEEFAAALGRVNEAALVLRNMVMLEENARFASKIALMRDLITITLNLPKLAIVVELQHYTLEMAEQLTKYWMLDSKDPLYVSLVAQADSTDRGKIITSLRALSRISMNLDVNNRLAEIPASVLQRICDWLLIDDEEIRHACLDFLYQFTAVTENVEELVHSVNTEGLVAHLTRLLLHNANSDMPKDRSKPPPKSTMMPQTAPKLASAIIEQLIVLDEPERSSQWLRTCYEEDPAGEITQIDLWQAYQRAFNDVLQKQAHQKPLMPAKDFITNVSATLTGASAQCHPISATQHRYTIKGIRPRSIPVDPVGRRPYLRCQWQIPATNANGLTVPQAQPSMVECNEFAVQPKQMWEHIVSVHLGITKDENGKWQLEPKTEVPGEASAQSRYDCHWGGCKHFAATKGDASAVKVGMHVKTHLPDASAMSSQRLKHNRSPSMSSSTNEIMYHHQTQHRAFNSYQHASIPRAPVQPFKWLNTAIDERADAAGLPLASVLVLRNLARQLAKVEYPGKSSGREGTQASKRPRHSYGSKHEDEEEEDEKEGGWVRRVFGPVKEELFYVMAHNWSLKEYMTSLTKAIIDGGDF